MDFLRRVAVVLALLAVPLLLALGSQQLAQQPGPPRVPANTSDVAVVTPGITEAPLPDTAPAPAPAASSPAEPTPTDVSPAQPAPSSPARSGQRGVTQVPAPPPADGGEGDDADDDDDDEGTGATGEDDWGE